MIIIEHKKNTMNIICTITMINLDENIYNSIMRKSSIGNTPKQLFMNYIYNF